MQSNQTLLLILLCAGAGALAAGVVGIILMIRGIRGRRVGSEPRCRTCDYTLVGIDSARCPECGTLLTKKTIVNGQRISRPWMAGIGGVLIMLAFVGGAAVATSVVRSINWYQTKPASLIMRDFRTPQMRAVALKEMMRRDGIAPIAQAYRDEIMQQALLAQVAAKPPPEITLLLIFADAQHRAGRLSDAQQKQLLEQCILTTLDVRKRVAAGDPVPYRLNESARTPLGWSVLIDSISASLDNEPVGASTGGSSRLSGTGAGGSIASTIPPPPVGEHALKLRFKVQMMRMRIQQQMSQMQYDPPMFEQERELTAKFTVVPAGDAPVVALRRASESSDAQKSAIEKAIRIESLSWSRYGSRRIEGTVVIDALPIGIAFEVFASFNGGEYPLGSITRASSEAGPMQFKLTARQVLNAPPPPKVDLIFRPNEKLAVRTIDLEEIAGDELVMKDVTVNVVSESNPQSIINP
jgi:hypothetical protein